MPAAVSGLLASPLYPAPRGPGPCEAISAFLHTTPAQTNIPEWKVALATND
jgi:hypothetical protein